jgi:hypothetical protein
MKRKSKKALKYTAKKVAAGHYLYRGWTIKRFDYGSLGDPEAGGVEWNVFSPGEENWNDSEPTLSLAKYIVDTRIKQAEQRVLSA